MNRIKIAISLFAFALVLLGLPAIASAQWGGRNNDPYGNGRYNRNIRGTVESLRNRARNFARDVDRVDDRRDDRRNDRWGNRNDRFDDLDRLAQQFEDAANDLRSAYGNGRNMNNSADEARRVLQIGGQIDNVIGNRNRRGGNNRVYREWSQIRQDLSVVADAYNYRNSGRSGTWRDRLPFPLPF